MIAENEAVINKRYNLVSVLLPLACAIMTFAGMLLAGINRLSEMIPPLIFAVCYGFIVTFIVDIRRKKTLGDTYKIVLLVTGTGVCFFVPWILDDFFLILVIILIISLFCAFLSLETSLVMLVGFCLYMWAFMPHLLGSNMVVYISSLLLISIVISFADGINKVIYSALIFSVFYLSLSFIFHGMDFSGIMNVNSFAVWIYSIAVIVCLFFIKGILNEDSQKATVSGFLSSVESTEPENFTDIVLEEHEVRENAEQAQAADNHTESDNTNDRSSDVENTGNRTINDADTVNISTENRTADSDINDSIPADGNNSDNVSDGAENNCSTDNTEENPEDAANSVSHDSNEYKVNRNLYDSIEELSARLMKLESENSVLQLMLNASVYDLGTIVDPDYPYVVKLREENPKYYSHCMNVAKISSDAAQLIGCDEEEAYAIGMYIKSLKLLGDGAVSALSSTYKVPKNIINSVVKINNKLEASVMSREAGIVMLTDDIINTYNYLKSKNNDDFSFERIVTNTFKVRKEQNYLRSAGFSNEEIQLLRVFYNDLGGAYDLSDTN